MLAFQQKGKNKLEILYFRFFGAKEK